jgi:16S rRNA (guanine527-N7)-methyltransferase
MQPDKNLQVYYDLLFKWQKTINLVSPSTLNNVWQRHFEDSLQIIKYLPANTNKVSDLGSGAGFPGLVIAMQRADIQMTLIESDSRKCAFLKTVSRETILPNIEIINDRIESVIDDLTPDIVTSRALASLKQLISLTHMQWRNNKNFKLLLLKGADYQKEIDEALKKYHFDYEVHASQTSTHSAILSVYNMSQRQL